MTRVIAFFSVLTLLLTACGPNPSGTAGDGTRVYKISSGDAAEIQFRMLDSVNSLRTTSGLGSVQLNSQLNAAAATHSRDMSVQNRPWHFGSDGSSPIDRTVRTGYTGRFLGENISESYESELVTLGAWMDQPDTRGVIMDPAARDLGFSWYQERGGKIWWTLIMGG
ncbi:CAP domain-containing protein [Aliiruegeria haliotis]|nr:CAP domain-containing protein [Aliiruegeria haliotis]